MVLGRHGCCGMSGDSGGDNLRVSAFHDGSAYQRLLESHCGTEDIVGTRGYVVLAGTFGYELDITKIPEKEREQIPKQVEMYHKYNDLVREWTTTVLRPSAKIISSTAGK